MSSPSRRGGKADRFRRLRTVYKRNGNVCFYCERELMPLDEAMALPDLSGRTPPDTYPTVEHVVPLSCGGSNSLSNIVAACYPCNVEKRERPPTKAELEKLTLWTNNSSLTSTA